MYWIGRLTSGKSSWENENGIYTTPSTDLASSRFDLKAVDWALSDETFLQSRIGAGLPKAHHLAKPRSP